jgi:hypothetical protein
MGRISRASTGLMGGCVENRDGGCVGETSGVEEDALVGIVRKCQS